MIPLSGYAKSVIWLINYEKTYSLTDEVSGLGLIRIVPGANNLS